MFAGLKSFIADVHSTVSAAIEDEKRKYADEQRKLSEQQREAEEAQKKRERQVVPLWAVWQDDKRHIEAELKQKILKLAKSRRTFMSPAPDASVFPFDMDNTWPFATHALKIDAGLDRARFILVPRQLREEEFWRNYFYRVENLRDMLKVESIFAVPQSEVVRRQRELVAARRAVAQPAAAPTSGGAARNAVGSSSSSSAAVAASSSRRDAANDDDEEFNENELNEYLEENDEPKVDTTPDNGSRADTPNQTMASAATTSNTPATEATNEAPAETSNTTPAAAVSHTDSEAATEPELVDAGDEEILSADTPVEETRSPVSASPASSPLAAPSQPTATPSPLSPPVSTPPTPSPLPPPSVTTSAPAATAAVIAPSPSSLSDEEDLDSELESLLHEVSGGVGAIVVDDDGTEELDEDQLAELENELDMP